jgi:FKBP-type peptidyl-prolyl cis-trans isomerase
MAEFKKEQDNELARQSKGIQDYFVKNNITTAQKTKNGAYVVVENAGTGPKADTGKQALVMYRGYLLDGGKVFDTNMDSTKGHTSPIPVTVGAHGVIPGWEEGLPYFGKGGKGKLFIPAGLGYGPQGSGEIPPNASLIFDIEIVDVKDAPPPAPQGNQMPQGMQQRRLMTAPPTAKPAH